VPADEFRRILIVVGFAIVVLLQRRAGRCSTAREILSFGF
jgi:hypothetical protein